MGAEGGSGRQRQEASLGGAQEDGAHVQRAIRSAFAEREDTGRGEPHHHHAGVQEAESGPSGENPRGNEGRPSNSINGTTAKVDDHGKRQRAKGQGHQHGRGRGVSGAPQ
eukprot:3991319-Pyramimonas_sp.AAC.1